MERWRRIPIRILGTRARRHFNLLDRDDLDLNRLAPLFLLPLLLPLRQPPPLHLRKKE